MNPDVQVRAKHLIEDLRKLKQDRGAMAELRRGFSEATAPYAWPYLARWCNLENERDRMIAQTIAAAFATHPDETDKGNLGDVLRGIAVEGRKDKKDVLKTFEAKFRRLLICEKPKEVCAFLPGIVRAAKQKGIAINYERLFVDLSYWPGQTRERWAQAFWTGAAQTGAAP